MKIKVKKYYYNLADSAQRAKYETLAESLRKRGSKLFDFIAAKDNTGIDGEFELEEAFIFNNQCNADDYRVFDWCEFIYPNRRIKSGHYIESGPGFDYLQNLRHTTKVCGYCGKQYPNAPDDLQWCKACVGSKYLEENEIHLLHLHFIVDSDKQRTEKPPVWLIELYHVEQKKARKARLEAAKTRKLQECQKQIESAKIEYEGFKQIIEAGLDFANCIYYSHTDRFCFGWRTPLTEAEKIEIGERLKKFSFEYDMK